MQSVNPLDAGITRTLVPVSYTHLALDILGEIKDVLDEIEERGDLLPKSLSLIHIS